MLQTPILTPLLQNPLVVVALSLLVRISSPALLLFLTFLTLTFYSLTIIRSKWSCDLFSLPPPSSSSNFYPRYIPIMSVVQLTPSPYNTRRQEVTLPLQPIQASHPANHCANVVTDPEEKSNAPTPTSTSAPRPPTLMFTNASLPTLFNHAIVCRPSTPIPELPIENTLLDFPELSGS